MNEERIKELLKELRTWEGDIVIGGMHVNRLDGLKTLIEENLNQNSIICEVGSFEGKSSELFALMCGHVYCIDVFHKEYNYETTFDNRMKSYKNVTKIKANSKDAYRQFQDEFFDFVYLDAGHEYVNIKLDIINWYKKVKKGGYFGGHDYQGNCPEVIKAVDEFFKPVKIYQDSSWIVRI